MNIDENSTNVRERPGYGSRMWRVKFVGNQGSCHWFCVVPPWFNISTGCQTRKPSVIRNTLQKPWLRRGSTYVYYIYIYTIYIINIYIYTYIRLVKQKVRGGIFLPASVTLPVFSPKLLLTVTECQVHLDALFTSSFT